MNKNDALKDINETQDYYVTKLCDIILGFDRRFDDLKEIDFTSPTGTGKTVMLAKLINLLPNYFFVVTSLSKGQLRYQIESKVSSLAKQNNYIVFGLNEFTKNTILQAKDFETLLPKDKKIIWVRDEGHIATNRWQEVLRKRSSYIINFSATNKNNNGVQCNFTHTMMLRTVVQNAGTPEESLDKLLEIKEIHRNIKNYNPCALFRIINDNNLNRVIKACEDRNLSYINITDEQFDMSDICMDDNKYDVIINKLKITEGIDLKRCHVIYMDSKPSNEATVVQIIGRARRNALFWRNDIDILDKQNAYLLEETRKCYIFYNVPETEIAQNELGELSYSLCDTVSVEALKPNIKINVKNGRLDNGLKIIELEGKTGTFEIKLDPQLKVNIVSNPQFYKETKIERNPFVIDLQEDNLNYRRIYLKPNIIGFFEKKIKQIKRDFDPRKYYFYLTKMYAERHPNELNIDFDYWSEYLGVEDHRNLIPDRKWTNYYYNPQTHAFFKAVIEGRFMQLFTKEEIEECKKKAKRYRDPEYVNKKEIFSYSFAYEKETISSELWPYIERVDYFDCSVDLTVYSELIKRHNVEQLSLNKFKYSRHPFAKFLKEKGIDSLEKLKEQVYKCKGNAVLYCGVTYWKELIKSISTFDEIDNYDVRIVNLEELNDTLKLGLTPIQIKEHAYGVDKVKKTKNISALPPLMKKNKKGCFVPCKDHCTRFIYKRDYENLYVNYIKTYNDYEIAAIGPDIMRYSDHEYIEDRTVTSKIRKYCKFNTFISNKYKEILQSNANNYFKQKNDYGFDKKCNSCLGFCVEYYAKIKLFGEDYFKPYIDAACSEAKTNEINDIIRVRAAMIIYRDQMRLCYGKVLSSIIPTISISNLVKDNYSSFVNKVVELGNISADFIRDKLFNGVVDKSSMLFDPDLSVNHISALCDFITEDTILDLKCTSSINESHLKQVLSYHYLSTKRNDLNIKRVIVFDAPTQKYIEVNLN